MGRARGPEVGRICLVGLGGAGMVGFGILDCIRLGWGLGAADKKASEAFVCSGIVTAGLN